jgi:hypothetical protein
MASRGLWSDPKFLETVSEMNPTLKQAQFSDYHGHGWMFQKVFKRDRKGNFLDTNGTIIPFDDPDLWKKSVHLKDIHLEKGMHCVDCHFKQDAHGTGKIYGDRRAAIEITCQDCHGTASTPATLITSGPASEERDLSVARITPFGVAQFQKRGGRITQRSMVTQDLQWTVPQVADTIDPSSEQFFNVKAQLAHTIQSDGRTWGDPKATNLAHTESRVACYSCHSSWTTNCFGCHLAAKVNTKKPMIHNSDDQTQVYASYNPEILRSDGFMLGVDGTVMLVERGHAQRAECHPRLGGQPGADDFVRWFHRQRVQHARAAYGARQGNQAVYRLSRVARRRQQRMALVGPDAWHQPGEFHGALHLCGAGRRRRRGRGGH